MELEVNDLEKEKNLKYIKGTGITELEIFADRISLERNNLAILVIRSVGNAKDGK